MQSSRITTRVTCAAAGLLAFVAAGGALAQTSEPAPSQFSEVRLGVLGHDVRFAGGREGGADFNAEVTSSTLVSPAATAWAPKWAQFMLQPRAHLGVEASFSGKTNQLYAGLTWTALLQRRLLRAEDALEFSFLFGPALNDGDHYGRTASRKSLGSNILFHLGAEVTYRVSARWSVGFFFDHSSNGGFARKNESLNDAGLRVAYRL